MNNRSLICCKLSRPTPSRAELTRHPAIPVGISDVSMRLMPTHRMSGEYSRGKVPKVVVFSRVLRAQVEPSGVVKTWRPRTHHWGCDSNPAPSIALVINTC